MKKILIVLFLLVLVAGCAKKLPPPVETVAPKEPVREAVKPEKEVVKETVKEPIVQKEAKLLEETGQREAAIAARERELSFVLKDVLFDYDKYNIRDDARPTLDSIASYLKKNEAVGILIEGHCDERGTNEYNLALGEKRAGAARDYLASLGVAASRMNTVTYGEEKPVCTEQNETCWQKNRRAHFVAQ